MQDGGGGFVTGFALQIPNWVVLIVLAVVLFGAWKLGKMVWSALEVSDLRIEVDYAAATAGITPFSISSIEREPVAGSDTFKWIITLNWPKGAISFWAAGFLQVLRSPAIVRDGQWLGHAERANLGG